MFSIGRMTSSLGSMSNELTLAAANLNFDFTLVKVEAPLEYRRLGQALSNQRRSSAEIGSAHTTARKLGALFENILPETPRLFEVYGQRASEIAVSHESNPVQENNGPFESHVGFDGTNIWAAATSGKRSIAAHLLACMLARMWKGPEAISIWVELIECRKKEILSSFESGSMQDFNTLMAAQQEVTRDHLSLWDASARAWLLSSDDACCTQQTQLRLVVDNVKYPISKKADVYLSVLEMWIDAMTSMEALISGEHQRVQNGALLLGLLSWHVYPDMLVLGSVTRKIELNDALIPGSGILTIGLNYSDQERDSGLYWSLSLAHLRYYGTTSRESQLTFDKSRITIQQLYQVVLGSLSALWKADVQEVAEFIVALHRALKADIRNVWSNQLNAFNPEYECLQVQGWFMCLVEAAEQFLQDQNKNQMMIKLRAFGARRAKSFLCTSDGFRPY